MGNYKDKTSQDADTNKDRQTHTPAKHNNNNIVNWSAITTGLYQTLLTYIPLEEFQHKGLHRIKDGYAVSIISKGIQLGYSWYIHIFFFKLCCKKILRYKI